MTVTIRQTLSDLGLVAFGRQRLHSDEEALELKRSRDRLVRAKCRAREQAAKAEGVQFDIRKRGRPRLYATPEEAYIVKQAQSRECRKRLNARITASLIALKEALDSATQQARSSSE